MLWHSGAAGDRGGTRPESISLIIPAGTCRLQPRWDMRATWNRVITNSNTDTDVILLGLGYGYQLL